MVTHEMMETILSGHGLRSAGAPLTRASGIIVALHGRGADAASILELADVLAQPDIAYLAPQARMRAWYPQPFIAPLQSNQPWLGESLGQVAGLLDSLAAAGVPDHLVGLMGFSQGACLALETAIRRPRPYGAVLGFSGGYIGPMGLVRRPEGKLTGANIFLGCSDIDHHIPLARVKDTTALMTAMGATVTERIYQGFGHAINDDEIMHARRLLATMQPAAAVHVGGQS